LPRPSVCRYYEALPSLVGKESERAHLTNAVALGKPLLMSNCKSFDGVAVLFIKNVPSATGYVIEGLDHITCPKLLVVSTCVFVPGVNLFGAIVLSLI